MRTITENQRLQLIGLMALAHEHNKATHAIIKAARAITKESDEYGHTADSVWDLNGGNADDLLAKLKIRVIPRARERSR